MRRFSRKQRGFTLIEVLISLVVFLIGGVGLLALFIANVHRARQAEDLNRVTEISQSVRSALEASVQSSPIILRGAGRNNTDRFLYPFSFPFASIDPMSPRREGAGVSQLDTNTGEQLRRNPIYFFELPTEPYRSDTRGVAETYTVLPRQLLNREGTEITERPASGADRRVWYYKPTELTLMGTDRLGEGVDLDNRDIYSFMVVIRRSVRRAPIETADGASTNRLLDGLYVVQLRVYRGYDPNRRDNQPIEEISFTINTPR